MGRILALDIGDVRIGLANSDLTKTIAGPLETYKRDKDPEKAAAYIAGLCRKLEVETIVCGLPVNLKGEETLQTRKVQGFISVLRRHTDIPVHLCDERLSTWAAEQVLLEGNVRRQDRKGVIDKVAAAIFLQSYLDGIKK